ncbi:MAG TPA: AMP-dependent synthetase/ligase [bacterium]|nr:AMP-dependent synthetase/ligase [bacterium]
MTNLPLCFRTSVERWRHRPCLRFFEGGRWKSLTWLELWDRVRELALGLQVLGIRSGDRVAILSATRYEWTLADLAILSLGAVTVPIYPSSTPDQVAYILENSGSKAVFLEDRLQLKKISGPRLRSLQCRILISGNGGRGALGWDDLRALAANGDEGAWERGWKDIQPEQTATIVYTSGTTGPPKGVVLSHGNFLEEGKVFTKVFDLCEKHTALLFLPLAHIFARTVQFWQLKDGFVHVYARSLETVLEDMGRVRPHFIASVPRIFEKIHENVEAKARQAGSRKKLLLKVLPFLLSRKIRMIFGGRLRFAISGGAPLAAEVGHYFYGHGVKIVEGYGLTETTAGIFINTAKHVRFGTVGRKVPGVQAKLAKDGEILIKGPTVFQGYYKDTSATRAAFTRDGWFKTGDIGKIDRDGFLKITDRKKDLIVTAAGKNIAPQNIESLLKASPYISHAVVHGDRRKYLTALVTLNAESVSRWMRGRGMRLNGYKNMGEHPEIRRLIRMTIEDKNKKLASYETIKRFAILEKDFSQEGGELTPTLKLKRKMVVEKYRDVLDSLYSNDVKNP